RWASSTCPVNSPRRPPTGSNWADRSRSTSWKPNTSAGSSHPHLRSTRPRRRWASTPAPSTASASGPVKRPTPSETERRRMTLRTRILLALAPLGLLLTGLGIAGFLLLNHMAGAIDAILKENYESVQAMFRLNESIERIDSSFQFALAGREDAAEK